MNWETLNKGSKQVLQAELARVEWIIELHINQQLQWELNDDSQVRLKLSIEEPLELELKKLLSHFEYVLLEVDSKLPVIIAADLDVGAFALIQ